VSDEREGGEADDDCEQHPAEEAGARERSLAGVGFHGRENDHVRNPGGLGEITALVSVRPTKFSHAVLVSVDTRPLTKILNRSANVNRV
jgi:hypothetical protein